MKKIVIIGGGVSGLSTLYFLKKKLKENNKEAELLLLEKSDRFGGQIKTEYLDDFIIEGGSDCFIKEKPWALELCREFGIEDSLINTNEENNGTFIFNRKKLHKLPDGLMLLVPTRFLPFATTGLFTIMGKLRMAIEMFIPTKKDDSDETLSNFVTRRFGKELLDKIAEPLIAGIHSGDPDKMSIKSTFPRFHQQEKDYGSLTRSTLAARKKMKEMMKKIAKSGEKQRTFFISFKKGMTQLIENLLERVKDEKIETGKEVKKITESGDGKYNIQLKNLDTISADSVIVSTQAIPAAKIFKDINSKISVNLEKIPYIKTGTVTIVYKKSDLNNIPKAFGFLVPHIEKKSIMGTTFTSFKWSNRCPDDYFMLRCFFGGKNHQDLIEKDDETIIKIVKNELKSILGIDAEPYLYKIFRWLDRPQYNLGHQDIIDNISNELKKHKGLFVTGSPYKGIGIPDCINNAEITAGKVIDDVM